MDVFKAYMQVFAALNKEKPKLDENIDPKRLQIIQIALSQVGKSDPMPYMKAVLADPSAADPDEEWCGIFALWVLHQAGIATDRKWELGIGFLGGLPTTEDPKPGDIGYSEHNNHHGIVESVEGNNINTIDGNSWEGKVQRNTRPRNFFKVFYSIQPFLNEAEKQAPTSIQPQSPQQPNPIQQQFENTMRLLSG